MRRESILKTLLHLSPARRRLLPQAAALVMIMRVALWVLPVRHVLELSALLGQQPRTGRSRRTPEGDLVWAVAVAGQRVPAATCLVKALAAVALLARHGYPAQLCVGVAHGASGRLEGHAWVEGDGHVIFGGSESHFVRLSLQRPGQGSGYEPGEEGLAALKRHWR